MRIFTQNLQGLLMISSATLRTLKELVAHLNLGRCKMSKVKQIRTTMHERQ